MGNNSENNFRDFFKNNVDFLFILDLSGNIIEINDAVRNILGFSDEDVVGKSVLMVHPPEFREKAGETVRKILLGEESLCLIPLLTKNNAYIPVETRVFRGLWDSKQVLIGVSRNLSEVKLSEEKFYNVFNNSNIQMSISDLKTGVFINVNKQFLDTFGYSYEEIIGTASKDLNLLYDYAQRQEALDIFEKEGKLDNFEAIIKTKSGGLLTCLFSLNKFKIQTYEYLLTSATNITQLKKAESKIQHLFKQQKLLADISQSLNSTQNFDQILGEVLKFIGEHTNVSRVYIYENTKDESTGTLTHEWCNSGIEPLPLERDERNYQLIPSWKKILSSEGRIYSNKIEELPDDLYQILSPQGIKTILVYPLHLQETFYGTIGFHECVSSQEWSEEEIDLLRTVSNIISNAMERKRVLDKLENSELRLKLTLNSAKEGLWDWNNITDEVYFSDTWCSMVGYAPEEIAPHFSSWVKLIHTDDMPLINEELTKHMNGETEYYEIAFRMKSKDGSWKWVLTHGKVIQRDENNKPMRTVGTHIDITRQKEIEEQLKESIDTKNKMFSIIAHDLRGPIGNFIPILDLLTDKEELDEDIKKTLLNELKKSTKTTFDLLENLLNWSRSQTNSLSLYPTHFIINNIIKDVVDLLSPSAAQKEITIDVKAEKSWSVFADIDTLTLVLRNLLSNSIKFTPHKGTITITVQNLGTQIEIEIADNGIGMEKDVVENMFKINSFTTTRGTSNEKGSGLGLVLCKDFIEKNGGQIRAESVWGEGSKFFITIPKCK